MQSQSASRKTVVILGGGFAGLQAAKRLSRKAEVDVYLLDRRNHHLFQPLLYQVATAGLNPSDIAVPIRSEFARVSNVQVHVAPAEKIDFRRSVVQAGDHEISYDFLIVACGAQHSYFGRDEWEEFAPGLKTLEQATEIRRRILVAFEEAENVLDPELQKAYLTFVVVGGGPTGVELAGAISDISRTVLVNDFKRINPADARVILVEAGKSVLSGFDEKLSRRAEKDLRRLHVEVRTGVRVTDVSPEGVRIGDEFQAARTVIWAAGVQATRLRYDPVPETDRAGRIRVEQDFSVPGFPNAFVVGDMAALELSEGVYMPGVAPAAIQSGRHAADTILDTIRGKERRKFVYRDKGLMATIGKNKAVAQTRRMRLSGYPAWLAWLFIHIFYLVGTKNKVSVMVYWMWSYLFSKRGARLITGKSWKLSESSTKETVLDDRPGIKSGAGESLSRAQTSRTR